MTAGACFAVIAGFPRPRRLPPAPLRRSAEFPAAWRRIFQPAGLAACGGLDQRTDHETHLPSLQSPARAHPWFPRAHEEPRRTRRDQRAAREGPQAAVRLSRQKPRVPWARGSGGPASNGCAMPPPSSACCEPALASSVLTSRSITLRSVRKHPTRLRTGQLFASYPQMHPQMGANMWMTSCARPLR